MKPASRSRKLSKGRGAKAMQGQITLAPIAERAGVSRMTVSRVLRGETIVAPATRDRVMRIARHLGYRPNPLVRALMAQRRAARRRVQPMGIAYVTSFRPRDAWQKHEAFRTFFLGAQERADRLGYRLEEFWTGGLKSGRIGAELVARGFQGVIMAPRPEPAGRFDLDWDTFGAAAIGLSLREPQLHRVSPNYYDAMLMALEHASASGYVRPGLVVPTETDTRHLSSWRAAMSVGAEDQHVPTLVLERWEKSAVMQWFQHFKPDVVFSVRREIVDWLKAAGARVPGAVGYVHFGWYEPLGRLAGVDLSGRAVGAAAVDLVAEQLTTNERGVPWSAKLVQLPVRWQSGSTLRRQKASRRLP